ncbi:putative C-_U-editing enzyme APOBEC-4 [Caloenas nicobarica]|uniref:putative C->U-editing enzyme APOBEC-4 n=1 Tax=Caloenas nicobarica TaxID=187106 RepID=UPI0032B710C8
MNPEEKTVFQEYLTNQGTVVKPYCWQRQCHTCAACPYHIQTGEEARVPYTEFHRVFGFPYRSTATPQNKHLHFYELRSFSGRLVQKGHATNGTDQDKHPESLLFEAGGYLGAVTGACANIRSTTLFSNFSPCNEAYHCCVTKIYNFLLKHPEITLCIYFSQLHHAEAGSPTAAWNREALRNLCGLWPRVTLQRLPGGTRHHLLCNFVYSIPGTSLCHPASPLRTSAGGQNARQINSLMEMKQYFRKAFPQAMPENPAAQHNLKPFSSPFQAMPGTLPPPMFQRCSVLFPGMFLPFRREHLYPRPKHIVRHLKMPKESFNEPHQSEGFPSSRHLL